MVLGEAAVVPQGSRAEPRRRPAHLFEILLAQLADRRLAEPGLSGRLIDGQLLVLHLLGEFGPSAFQAGEPEAVGLAAQPPLPALRIPAFRALLACGTCVVLRLPCP